jgi:hypothetical protein
MYHHKMERPMSNAKSTRTPTLPELFGDNKSSLLLLQVQDNNQFNNRLMTTPVNKHMRHLLLLNNDAMTIHLAPTGRVQETSSGTSNATALKSTTHRKLT